MKYKTNPLLLICLFLVCCSNNSPENASVEKSVATNSAVSQDQQNNDIVGEWELINIIPDDNRNAKIDDDERKKAFTKDQAKDYMKINSDGSGVFSQVKWKGRYEVVSKSGGKRKLILYDKDNNKEDRGYIFSVTKDELILLSYSTFQRFSVYKRV